MARQCWLTAPNSLACKRTRWGAMRAAKWFGLVSYTLPVLGARLVGRLGPDLSHDGAHLFTDAGLGD